jgi:Fe-S-cluster containining protein
VVVLILDEIHLITFDIKLLIDQYGYMAEVYCGSCCSDIRLSLSPEEAEGFATTGSETLVVLPFFKDLPDDREFDWSEKVHDLEVFAATCRDPDERAYWQDIATHATGMQPGEGLFEVRGNCGFLQPDGSCGNYDERPRACRAFSVGSTACRTICQRPTPVSVEITRRPTKIPAIA